VRRVAPILGTLLLAVPVFAGSRPTTTVTVFAAASLSDVFTEIGKRVEREHPGWRVRFNFGGSNQLALQIENGAQADVFASADAPWMESLARRGRLEGRAQVFARNRMIAVIPRTNPARIAGLRDLAKPGVKLVLAGDVVPAGRYAREILRRLAELPDYGEDYSRRVLRNLVSEEENVRAVVTKVQLGEADAGFCYVTDALGPPARLLRTIPIPDDRNVLAEYPIAVVASSPRAEAARAFVERVLSPEGQRVLARYGFLGAGEPAK
jgi:molybdate transport system substrate-binding protein